MITLLQKNLLGGTPTGSRTQRQPPMVSPTLLNSVSKSIPLPAPAPVPSPASAPAFGSLKHQVVLTGIDTLHLTAGGNGTPTEWLYNQSVVWNEYQHSYECGEEYITIQLPDNNWWVLSPYGRKTYKYTLHNNEIGYIAIWNPEKWSSAVAGKQQILLHLNSKFLHQHKINELPQAVNSILSYFFTNVNDIEVLVSRGDLHTDITNGLNMLSYEEVSSSISRSKIRSQYWDVDNDIQLNANEFDTLFGCPPDPYNKGGQKLIDTTLLDKLKRIYETQLHYGATNTIKSKNLETAYYGTTKSDIWGKCYNKSKEVKKKCDTDTPLLWEQNGYNGNDTVVRIEFSMRRGFLKELNNGKYISLIGFINNTNVIWEYLTTKWLRLVEEVKDNNTTTSVITKFWQLVQLSFSKATEVVIRKKTYNGKIIQLWKQGIGCISQMVAIGMNTNFDTSFLYSTIQALQDTLQQHSEDGKLYDRRQRLGLA
jgi:hypothetical protein